MRTLRVLKLGLVCEDKAIGLQGTLTHWIVNMGGGVRYLFQPKGLDEEGQPVQRLCLEEERMKIKPEDFEMVEVPFDILGTEVTDKASGFKGMAVEFVRHINGCFHVIVQPKGMHPVKKVPIKPYDFDLRQCTGPKIVELDKAALAKSKKDHPSPTGDSIPSIVPPGY